MKILIRQGHHDLLDAGIKLCTHGKGSHAMFLRDDNKTIHEAFWPRVRDRAVTDEDRGTSTEVYYIAGQTADEAMAFERWFDQNLKDGIDYSYFDLVRYALNIPNADERFTFCSRYVLHGCRMILPQFKWPLVRLPCDDWGSPRDLRISPILLPTTFDS